MNNANQNHMLKRGIAAGIITAAILLILGSSIKIFHTELIQNSYVLELGEQASLDPYTYLEGYFFTVEAFQVDDSAVDYLSVGDYTVFLHSFWRDYSCTVQIRDTIGPTITLKNKEIVLLPNEQLLPESIVEDVSDLCGETQISIVKPDSFSETGRYQIEVVATDRTGNTSIVTKEIIVDTAPIINPVPEYYVTTGCNIDYLQGVTAEDDCDGDISGQIICDSSQVDSDTPGDYLLLYAVSDSFGLSATTQSMVHVYEPMELQRLIDERELDPESENINGNVNPFVAPIFKTDSIETSAELMDPYVVYLYIKRENGSWTKGSGFILTMNDTDIIICTNSHVAKSDAYKDVTFLDNVCVRGEVIFQGEGDGSYNDVSFLRVKAADIPKETLKKIKCVHIDLEYYNALGENEPVEVAMRCRNGDGVIWFEKNGYLQDKNHTYSVDDAAGSQFGVMLMASIPLVPGTSGSALVSKEGNLLGMATSVFEEENCFVQLPVILDDFEKVFGIRIEYQ